MSAVHYISTDFLTLNQIKHIIKEKKQLALSDSARKLIQKCRTYLDNKIAASKEPFYGINTGFGSLCNVSISNQALEELQSNLVMSHACGIGEEVPVEVVRIMLLLKIQSLSYGHSGVRVLLVEQLIEFYNKDIIPVIFQQGSLGASGDLAPLAHLSLPLLGLGEVYYKEKRQQTKDVLEYCQLKTIKLQSKEGIALLNGTQFSLAYSVWASLKAQQLSDLSDLIAAVSLDAFNCRLSPFDERLHQIRPHEGQIKTAKTIRKYLKDSPIAKLKDKVDVQDPYAFRCIPQVHGASKHAIKHVCEVVTIEINAVTDNPNIFPETDTILSGGNFHAQPLALPLDYIAIALAELGSISERRVYQLISGQRNLPAFLTKGAGLHSGLMITQYTAASIVSQNKQLCTPASVDSIISCNGKEDHVSMAANAATKLYKVVKNLESLLAIELLTASQALSFRRPLRSSLIIETFIANYRQSVSIIEQDRILHNDIRKTIDFLENYAIK